MSLLLTNCHGYSATSGISAFPISTTKAWVFGWFKTDGTGCPHRGIAQLTASTTFDGTNTYIGLGLDGNPVLVGAARASNSLSTSPDPGDFYFWQAGQLSKWTVGCAVFDSGASSLDISCIFGRAAATAYPANTTSTGNLTAIDVALTQLYVGVDRRLINNGDDQNATSGIKLAYIAVGVGSVPSEADIQACIDGQHPADLTGVWEYWDLTSSSAGLVGALQGITLAPFGGSATTTWDGADNPTVSAPTGGGGDVTVAASGSAITPGAGTQSPAFSIGL